jgi:hypothetical protein
MTRLTLAQTQPQIPTTSPLSKGSILQRKCESCGNHRIAGGDCTDCTKKKSSFQRKLAIGASNDPLEQEADRVADQVMAAPTHPAVSSAPPRIQRFTGQMTEGMGTAPASVERVLSSPGRPLDPAIQQDMGQRFNHDFSRVRVHTDGLAERSAQDVSANAYTVRHNIVFGAGQFAPETDRGRRLIAHELTHVVQQSGSIEIHASQSSETGGLSNVVSGSSVSIRGFANPLVQRDKPQGSSGGDKVQGAEFLLPPDVGGTSKELEQELLRRNILKPGDYDSVDWFWADATYFLKNGYRVVDVLFIRDKNRVITGFRVISYLQSSSKGNTPTQTPKAAPSVKAPATPKTTAKPKATTPVKPLPTAPQTVTPTPPPSTKTADEMQAELNALPKSIKDLLRGGEEIKPENLAQLLRIANKLQQLEPEDLALYKLLAKKLAADLDAFERSVDFFVQFKAQIKAQANTEKTKQATNKEPTLEEKLSKTWNQFDESKFGGMNVSQKEALARDIAAQQRNIQLEHMATHPGETAVGMVEGVVRVDKTAKAIAEDVKDAVDGDKGAYTRMAGAVGAYNKYVAAAASIVFIALLFVPGVNLIELAVAGLAVGAATIVLSVAESELRIKAAGEAKTPEEYKTDIAKSAAAQTQAVVAAAMIALTLAMKIIARIPLPGRYQNVGAAMKAAQSALLKKSGIGPAWQSVKTELLSKLRSSKQGLPEALAEQSKSISETAKAVEAMSNDEFVKQLAAGDPKLADLGISSDQAKAIQQISGTPEGKGIPERLRQDSLKALQDAPVEAGKKVDQFLKNVDDAIEKVEKAQSEEQLKSAVDDANTHLSAEEQARQAAKDEQAFLKKRLETAGREGVREQAKLKLEKLQEQQSQTNTKIVELENELSQARLKVNRLKEKVNNSPRGSEARAKALEEFNAAKEELNDLLESDELGGYKEEKKKQSKAEEAILESLELKRPGLWQSTKDTIRKAAKRNSDGKFLDANTGEVIEGEPVYGHIKGRENRRLILKASAKGMTQEQFTQWVNEHPEWFQLETEANNLSHKFEKPGIAGWEQIE